MSFEILHAVSFTNLTLPKDLLGVVSGGGRTGAVHFAAGSGSASDGRGLGRGAAGLGQGCGGDWRAGVSICVPADGISLAAGGVHHVRE